MVAIMIGPEQMVISWRFSGSLEHYIEQRTKTAVSWGMLSQLPRSGRLSPEHMDALNFCNWPVDAIILFSFKKIDIMVKHFTHGVECEFYDNLRTYCRGICFKMMTILDNLSHN